MRSREELAKCVIASIEIEGQPVSKEVIDLLNSDLSDEERFRKILEFHKISVDKQY